MRQRLGIGFGLGFGLGSGIELGVRLGLGLPVPEAEGASSEGIAVEGGRVRKKRMGSGLGLWLDVRMEAKIGSASSSIFPTGKGPSTSHRAMGGASRAGPRAIDGWMRGALME